jgi:hypothetical protein
MSIHRGWVMIDNGIVYGLVWLEYGLAQLVLGTYRLVKDGPLGQRCPPAVLP